MVSLKRSRDPAELGTSGTRADKHARLSGAGGPPSLTNVPSGSQPPYGYLSTPPSSGVRLSQPSLSRYEEEDEEVNNLSQYDEASSLDLYGTHDAKVVGVRYYNGVATPHELVICRREPANQYDRNAIRVDNVMGAQIGHLPRKLVEKLAPYIDRNDIVLEGVLMGEKGFYDCPIKLFLYGTGNSARRLTLEDKLKGDKLLKATEMKITRKEAEARRNVTRLQSGSTSGTGLHNQSTSAATLQKQELDVSLQYLVAASEALDTLRTDGFTDTLTTGQDELEMLPMAQQPSELKSQLLPYQLQGLAWMQSKEDPQLPVASSNDIVQLWKRRGHSQFMNLASSFITSSPPKLISGGILADDMGLGKTLQIISLIVSQGLHKGPTLIVSPVSVLSNWEQQFNQHVQENCRPRVLVYYSGRTLTASSLRDYDVVITTYGMVTSSFKNTASSSQLFGVEWCRVVLDEGHIIRNAKSQTAQAVGNLKGKSRWILTGTPIINNVKDFFSLIRFLKLTGGLEDEGLFSQVIARPIKQSYNSHPQRIKALQLLSHLLKDVCLRRKKDMKFINLNLPPKTEYVHRISFSKSEEIKYNAVLSEAQGELEKYQHRSKHGQKGRYTSILERLLRLRQICNHWALCKDRVDDLMKLFEDQKILPLNDKNISILQKALELMVESQEECPICFEQIVLHTPVITACKHVFGKPCITKAIELQGKCPMCRAELKPELLVEAATETGENLDVGDETKSAKTEALLQILQASLTKQGSKIIIFSQWTSFLNIVQSRLKNAGILCTRIDGSMPKKARDASIAALNEDADTRVLLASLQVCSVGLNLVAADTVILADSWWAPAIEDQAIDRVHRLGQTRPTTVWRLVIEGTIEERVLDIQADKRKLVGEAFREKCNSGKATDTHTMADIARLLS
ncbi:SNF2 family N-terminal domain-containing protein [Xylariales sp. PMI_506]|nr:SNF2 family N-terminal domain-containing protein [Xylariales sp. PMI_506]